MGMACLKGFEITQGKALPTFLREIWNLERRKREGTISSTLWSQQAQ